MASTLAGQLAQLSKAHVAFTPRGKPSFLYDAAAAADLDVATLLASALHGAPPPCTLNGLASLAELAHREAPVASSVPIVRPPQLARL
jgi:hypothetical protein